MPTHYAGDEQEKLALDTYIKLSRAYESFDARLLRHHSLGDLTITQFAVLEALYHLGPLSQTEIGHKLLKSGGNITLVIDNLEKHGFVTRRRCQVDRRVTYVDLTPEGERAIAETLPRHVAAIVEEFSVLDKNEQLELGRLLRKLGKRPATEEATTCDERGTACRLAEAIYEYDI